MTINWVFNFRNLELGRMMQLCLLVLTVSALMIKQVVNAEDESADENDAENSRENAGKVIKRDLQCKYLCNYDWDESERSSTGSKPLESCKAIYTASGDEKNCTCFKLSVGGDCFCSRKSIPVCDSCLHSKWCGDNKNKKWVIFNINQCFVYLFWLRWIMTETTSSSLTGRRGDEYDLVIFIWGMKINKSESVCSWFTYVDRLL